MKKPQNWRMGQTVFNYLDWLGQKGYCSLNQSQRMANSFYLSDEDWDKYYEEFLKEVK